MADAAGPVAGASPTRIVLVRHGEAQCHVDQIVGGLKGCTGLSDLGRRQAVALRDRLAASGELAGADVLYASTLPRAVETAELLAPAFGGVPVEQDEDLCELHPGEADGITWEEFRAQYTWPGGWDGSFYRPIAPGAESWALFSARVGRALTRLATDHAGRTVVVACHGGVIENSFRALGQLSLNPQFLVRIDNTSITEWESGAETDERRWTLARFNDAAHLSALD
ncbi:MAG TPA: histidine phosphatase family protein [Acidimicrobiales bacterium]|nr:histidine phosphatase family protein [Acidimicrobiales bacterium]